MAMEERVKQLVAVEREERDRAIRQAVEHGVPKSKLAAEMCMTPQWLNRILKGEAYRRKTD
jgi:hypothetical protein